MERGQLSSFSFTFYMTSRRDHIAWPAIAGSVARDKLLCDRATVTISPKRTDGFGALALVSIYPKKLRLRSHRANRSQEALHFCWW